MNDMEPQSNNSMPPGQVDHEGAMAKADLFKLANYSVKLFKKIEDNQQLEAWVQAKITKAADYVASVYHYLEYEMKFSEFGAKLENSEMYSESEKQELKNKLNEAKSILRTIKLAQAQKLDESKKTKEKSTKKQPYDFDAAAKHDEEEYQLDRKDPYRHSINPKDDEQYDRDQDREYYHYNESWDDDDEDDDVKRADSELKKRGVKLPKVKEKEVPIKKTRKDREEEELDEMYGVGVYEDYDDDDEDDDVKRADSELKKRGVKLPKVKHKEVPVKKTAKDKDEEQLDEISQKTAVGYVKKVADNAKSNKDTFTDKRLKGVITASNKVMGKPHAKVPATNEGAGPYQLSDPKHPKFKANYEKFKKANPDKKLADFVADQAKKEKKGGLDEAAPSAGLSAKKKSATVKKAKAGGDIGKPGKGFEKVASKAAKTYGSKEKGEKVAAAAMWKNMKREDVTEGRRGGSTDNFTHADIAQFDKMTDLEEMKALALKLINTPSKKPMKPEKIRHFTSGIESATKPTDIIQIMWSMFMSGEGQGVIGSRYSMAPSGYRKRFSEGSDEHGSFVQHAAEILADFGLTSEEITAPEDVELGLQHNRGALSMWRTIGEDEQWELVDHIANAVYDLTGSDDSGAYDDNDPKNPNWGADRLNESAELAAIKSLTKRLLG